MEKDLILKKIESLLRCVSRIKEQGDISQNALESDFDLQDIVVLNIERAIQICVDIGNHILLDFNVEGPRTMAETFEMLEKHKIIDKEIANVMKGAVGFRNIAVHQYEKLNMEIVEAVVNKHLSDFQMFVKEIVQFLERK